MELQDHLTVAFYPSDQLVLTKDISVSLYLQKYDMEKKKKRHLIQLTSFSLAKEKIWVKRIPWVLQGKFREYLFKLGQ